MVEDGVVDALPLSYTGFMEGDDALAVSLKLPN
jgi:hypothetical protein